MGRRISCLRCGAAMKHLFTENIQLGKTGLVSGSLPNLIAGAMYVAVYCCPSCGKLELFSAEEPETTLPQVTCPRCGHRHDFDFPACPFCKHRY